MPSRPFPERNVSSCSLYLASPELGSEERLGVRIRDECGHYWTTRLESAHQGEERAYLLEVPSNVKTVVAEIVVLKPVQAEFYVRTAALKER